MPEAIFLILFFGILVWVVFVFFTKYGKGVVFGGKIIKTYNGVKGKRRIVTSRVKVHAVEAAPTVRFVGLEISNSTFGGFQMIPITLPASEAKELARLLNEAVDYQQTNES